MLTVKIPVNCIRVRQYAGMKKSTSMLKKKNQDRSHFRGRERYIVRPKMYAELKCWHCICFSCLTAAIGKTNDEYIKTILCVSADYEEKKLQLVHLLFYHTYTRNRTGIFFDAWCPNEKKNTYTYRTKMEYYLRYKENVLLWNNKYYTETRCINNRIWACMVYWNIQGTVLTVLAQ